MKRDVRDLLGAIEVDRFSVPLSVALRRAHAAVATDEGGGK